MRFLLALELFLAVDSKSNEKMNAQVARTSVVATIRSACVG